MNIQGYGVKPSNKQTKSMKIPENTKYTKDVQVKQKQKETKPGFFDKIFSSNDKPEIQPNNDIKQNQTKEEISFLQRYRACMVLSAVGDAMGYKNGDWQFNTSSQIIHKQMMEMTKQKGISQLQIDLQWRYSDDTVMHIGTAKALIAQKQSLNNIAQVGKQLAIQYKKTRSLMAGRAPGKTCMKNILRLEGDGSNWAQTPYNTRSVGCGGSMRSACIGLVYWRPQQIKQLIAVSIEAGRITHHNPIGYLGSMAAAYFTSLAIQGVPVRLWVRELFTIALPESQKYIESGRQAKQNLSSEYWDKFIERFENFAKHRKLALKEGQDKQPYFPQNYDLKARDDFYREITFTNWPGASGVDSVLIAYDAILGAETFKKNSQKWEQFCLRGILHFGDNDSTGGIGGAWFGALHGFQGVPEKNYKKVEDNNKLKIYGENLYKISGR